MSTLRIAASICCGLLAAACLLVAIQAAPAAAAERAYLGYGMWVPQASSPVHLRSIVAVDDNHVWAAGDSGTIMATTDGGIHWLTQDSGTDDSLSSLCFVDDLHGWVAGQNGDYFATSDGGAHWSAHSLPGGLTMSLYFVDASDGWAAGGNTIVATTDGGASWTSQRAAADESNLGAPCFVDSQRGWVAGQVAGAAPGETDGILLATTDGGGSWTSRDVGPGSTIAGIDARLSPNSLAEVDWAAVGTVLPLNLFIMGSPIDELGYLFFDRARDVSVVDAQSVWILGEEGLYFYSDHFLRSGPVGYAFCESVSAPDLKHAWAAGDGIYALDAIQPTPRVHDAVVSRGRRVTLHFSIADVAGTSVSGRLVVRDIHGHVRRSFPFTDQPANTPLSVSFTCWLPRGTNHFSVSASDSDGLTQSKRAIGRLIVR